MPLSSIDVRQILGESSEAHLARMKKRLKAGETTAGNSNVSPLARRTFEILKAIEGSLPSKKKFSDGDLTALKVIWDLADRSHDTLKKFEESRSDFSELFRVCNQIDNESDIMNWYIYRNSKTFEVTLVKNEPKERIVAKAKNVELRLRRLKNQREGLLLKLRAGMVPDSENGTLTELEKIKIEMEINVLYESILDLEHQVLNSDHESLSSDRLLSQPSYNGFQLKTSIKEVLSLRRKLNNTHGKIDEKWGAGNLKSV